MVPAAIKVLSEIINGGHNANAKVKLDALKTTLSRTGSPESKELAVTGMMMAVNLHAQIDAAPAPAAPQRSDEELSRAIELERESWKALDPDS